MKAATGIQPSANSVRATGPRLRGCGCGRKCGSALKPEYFEEEDESLLPVLLLLLLLLVEALGVSADDEAAVEGGVLFDEKRQCALMDGATDVRADTPSRITDAGFSIVRSANAMSRLVMMMGTCEQEESSFIHGKFTGKKEQKLNDDSEWRTARPDFILNRHSNTASCSRRRLPRLTAMVWPTLHQTSCSQHRYG